MKLSEISSPVLFYTVPIGAVIRFNGSKAMKVSALTVDFLEDSEGNAIDLAKYPEYKGTTQAAIGGSYVRILELPAKVRKAPEAIPAKLLRNYLAREIKSRRKFLRGLSPSNSSLANRERLESELKGFLFAAKDLSFISKNLGLYSGTIDLA